LGSFPLGRVLGVISDHSICESCTEEALL